MSRRRLEIGLATFCAASTAFLVYRDLWVESARNTEVWFGFELTGSAAVATAPLHWALFAAAAWAFWTRRPWVWPASIAYALYIAASHLVWNLTSPSGGGLAAGAWQLVLFSLPALLLWRLRPA